MRPPPPLLLRSVLFVCALTAAQAGSANDASAALRIAIAQLRSQAAELALLQQQARRGDLPPRYVRAHATQLAQAMQRTCQELGDAPAPTSAQPLAALAQAAGRDLTDETSLLARSGRDAGTGRGASWHAQLKRAEQSLSPAS